MYSIELIWALDWFLVSMDVSGSGSHYNLYMGLGIDNSLHDHEVKLICIHIIDMSMIYDFNSLTKPN